MSIRILAVMVRYRTALTDSATMKSLLAEFSAVPGIAQHYSVLVWDNSPEPLKDLPSTLPMIYRHDVSNGGTSGAFNHAAAFAEENGYEWLLLLDQDSSLPPAFLREMYRTVEKVAADHSVAAVTPTVMVGDDVVSPRRILLNRHREYPRGEQGIAPGEATAINSATLLRVESLLAIGGYHRLFWLDYSDWYVFHQLYLAGLKVWRAADIVLHHDMSLLNLENFMSEERFGNFLEAEDAFQSLYKGRLENALQTLRLLVRTWTTHRRHANKAYAGLTWKMFLRRLRFRKAERLKRYQDKAGLMHDGAGSSTSTGGNA